MTRKWIIVNNQSNANYDVGNEIKYLKIFVYIYEMNKFNLWANISNIGYNGHQVAFKSCASFTKCITKNYGTTIDDAEYLDLAC